MNWEAVGALGELLGALLLLGSLMYVGLQLRETRKQMQAAAGQARADSMIELWKVRFEPGFMRAESKASENPESLTEEEVAMLINFMAMFFTFMQNNYYQRKAGTLAEDQEGALDSMPLVANNAFYRERWEKAKVAGVFSEEFVNHVDKVLAST